MADPGLKAAITGWISTQNQLDATAKHPWILDGRSEWTLLNGGWRKALSTDFTLNPFPVIAPPSEGAAEAIRSVTLCVAPVQAMELTKLEIRIVSVGLSVDAPLTRGETLNITLPPKVTAVAFLTQEESASRRDAVLQAYSAVAGNAWKIADQNGIRIGSRPKELDRLAAEAGIAALYNMARDNIPFQFWGVWPQPRARIEHTVDQVCCTLTVTGVQMAQKAVIRVEPKLSQPPEKKSTPEKKSEKPNGVTASPARISENPPGPLAVDSNQRRAAVLAQHTEVALGVRFRAALVSFSDTVVTFAQIDSMRGDLAAAREIYPDVRLAVSKENPAAIVFDTDNRWTILGVDLTAGIGYSAEDKWIGKAEFHGDNLIFQIPDNLNPKETESLSYAGGGEVQKLNAHWELTWSHDHAGGAQSTFGPMLSGNYLQDLNQRFGNLNGPALKDKEGSVEPGFSYAFSPSQIDRQGNPSKHLFGITAAAGFRYRRVQIEPEQGAVPVNANGALTGFFLNATGNYRYQPAALGHSRVGGFEARTSANALKGFSWGDFRFTQFLVSLQGAVYFGISDPRDFFLRFRKGAGTSNGNTPLFALFRLGGADTLRGMEQGEYVGRKLAFEQSEAAISARQIASWFRSRTSPDAETTPKTSPLDLSKLYLKGFYDRARIGTSAGASDLLAFRHGKKSYGLAAELQGLSAGARRVGLTVGYANSPDSVLHRNGLMFTAASIDF